MVIETVSDDDGNLYSDIKGVFNTKEESVKCLKERHEDCLTNFNQPYDDYQEESYFDINEEDDFSIRTICEIKEVEI